MPPSCTRGSARSLQQTPCEMQHADGAADARCAGQSMQRCCCGFVIIVAGGAAVPLVERAARGARDAQGPAAGVPLTMGCHACARALASVSVSTSLLAPSHPLRPIPSHLVPSRPVPSLSLPSGARPRTRRHGLQWEHALKLAKTLAPHELPQISLKFGSHLEFRGEYQQARSHLGPFPT